MPDVTLVIAHRGASRDERENTVAAFRRAAVLGADGVELDVRRTADDHLVVHHDPRLADGRVIRSTARADLPSEIPDLAAALDACDGVFVNLEIKNDPTEPDFDPTEWLAERVVDELRRRGPIHRWLVSSFRAETVAACRRLEPGLRTALLVEEHDAVDPDAVVAAGHVALHPPVVGLTESMVRTLHLAGLQVNVWTCNDPGRIAELMGWGVDGICTDVPDVALAVRSRP